MQDIEKMKKEIGEKIKEKREKLNLSQEQLADKLGYKSKTSIHKVEQGMTDLPQSKIIEFAKALNTTPTYLMGLEIPEEIPNSIPEVEFMSIPLYASVSAGYGSCQSEFIKMIAIPGLKPNGTTYFAVKVKGDSMEPKIPDNSTVI